MSDPTARIPNTALARYSLLAIPLAFAGIPSYMHAPDFYATEYNVSLSAMAAVLLGLRLIDAIQDPLIGKLSDQYARHRPMIMLTASVALVIGFVALFTPFFHQYLLIWFAVSLFVATTAFSIIGINLNTLGGLWSQDHFQKVRITTVREAFGLFGLLLAVITPSVLLLFMSKPQAFASMSFMVLALSVVGMFGFQSWYKNNALSMQAPTNQPTPHFSSLKNLPHQTRLFFATYAVSMLASSIPVILVLFFIRDRLGAESATGPFLLLYFLAGAVGMPMWQVLSKRLGAYKAWMLAMVLASLSFVWAFTLGTGDIWPFALICIISGLAFGADLALPPAILAEHIQSAHSTRTASLQFGVFSFLAKFALALASVLVLPGLEAAGFQPGIQNTSRALFVLSLSYAAIPCFIKLISVGLLWRLQHYPIGDSHDQTRSSPHNRSHTHA